MQRTIYPRIDDNYDPKAESPDTIGSFHTHNAKAANLLISIQVLFPFIALFLLLLPILHYNKCNNSQSKTKAEKMKLTLITSDPEEHFEFDVEQIEESNIQYLEDEMKAKLCVVIPLSFVFSLFSLSMSSVAVNQSMNLDKDLAAWYDHQQMQLHNIPALMLVGDLFTFVSFLLCYVLLCTFEYEHECDLADSERRKYFIFAFLFPGFNLAIHGTSIIIAFIHNQVHATSIGVAYVALIFISVNVLRTVYNCLKKVSYYIILLISFIFLSVLIDLIYAYIISLYIILPINNAFDKASTGIRLFYSAVIFSFTIFFTYWFTAKK